MPGTRGNAPGAGTGRGAVNEPAAASRVELFQENDMPTILSRAGVVTALVLAATFLPDSAAAFEIYTWVDDQGVVHYSEWRPEEPAATPVETLHIASTNPPAYDPDDDYYSILNQAERIDDQWSALQEEKAEAEARARAAAAEARIAELEHRLAAREAADYVTPRPLYAPFVHLPNRHHRFPNHGGHSRATHDRHPPPQSDRDLTVPSAAPRPGWTRPGSPAAPARPGFAH